MRVSLGDTMVFSEAPPPVGVMASNDPPACPPGSAYVYSAANGGGSCYQQATANMVFCPGGGQALPGQCASLPGQSSSGVTVPAAPPSIAPSSTIPTSVTNVATALNVSPATIQNDTSGFWTGFYAAMAKASIDPASSPASLIQTAYQQYAGVSTSSGVSPLLLLGVAAVALFAFGGTK